jgi:VanZ family protein
MIRTLARIAAWLLAAFIVFATLSPLGMRPRTGGSPELERFAAYLLLGLACGVGYPSRRRLIAAGLVVFAFGLEAAQTLIPTRDGRLPDAIQKGAGALCGAVCAFGVERLAARFGWGALLDGRHRKGPA